MGNVIRTLIVDDSGSTRRVLPELLKTQSNIEIVGTARNGREALERVATLKPDLVLMDLYMPEMDGAEATHLLRQRFPEVRVIAVSMDDSDKARQASQASGADGFIWKLYLRRDLSSHVERLFADIPSHLG